MHFNKRVTSFFTLALLLFCIALILMPQSHHFSLPTRVENQSPDWFMKNATAMKTDEQGKIKGLVTSPSMVHYSADDVIDMQQPFFTLFDNGGIPWHINANTAQVFQKKNNNHIQLNKNVIVKQMPGKGSNEVTLTTDHLTFFPDTSIAKTDAAVTITEPGSTIQAVGFEADLKQGIIKFLSNSRAEYHVQENQSAP